MKKTLLAWLAIGAVAALSAAATHWALCGRPAARLDRLADTPFLARELGLSPAQALEISQLQNTTGVKLADCCARHCAARAQLGQVLAGGAAGDAPAQAILRTMSQAYEDSERAMWEHIQRVRALLTPAQRARYDALVERSVCGTCNMQGVLTTPKM